MDEDLHRKKYFRDQKHKKIEKKKHEKHTNKKTFKRDFGYIKDENLRKIFESHSEYSQEISKPNDGRLVDFIKKKPQGITKEEPIEKQKELIEEETKEILEEKPEKIKKIHEEGPIEEQKELVKEEPKEIPEEKLLEDKESEDFSEEELPENLTKDEFFEDLSEKEPERLIEKKKVKLNFKKKPEKIKKIHKEEPIEGQKELIEELEEIPEEKPEKIKEHIRGKQKKPFIKSKSVIKGKKSSKKIVKKDIKKQQKKASEIIKKHIEEKQRKVLVEPKKIIKEISEQKVYKTHIDGLLELIEKKKVVSIKQIINDFKITREQAEEWGRILEEQGLLRLNYPAFGELEFMQKDFVKPIKKKKFNLKKISIPIKKINIIILIGVIIILLTFPIFKGFFKEKITSPLKEKLGQTTTIFSSNSYECILKEESVELKYTVKNGIMRVEGKVNKNKVLSIIKDGSMYSYDLAEDKWIKTNIPENLVIPKIGETSASGMDCNSKMTSNDLFEIPKDKIE